MHTLRWMAALMAAGAVSVLVLGRLPMMEWQMNHLRSAAVSAYAPPITLSDDNLVDALGPLRLHHRLARVGWDHSILSLDVHLRGEQAPPSALAKDISALLRFAFEETANVQQALIRVYRTAESGERELLFYGDPRRDAWEMAQEAGHAGTSETDLRRLLAAYRLSVTPAGDRWLQLIAN